MLVSVYTLIKSAFLTRYGEAALRMVADLSHSTVELTESSYCHLSVQLLVSNKLATT